VPFRTAPTPSLFTSSSLLRPLTPLFPLDASHSPVTPLFPPYPERHLRRVHTQKHGAGGYLQVPPSHLSSSSFSLSTFFNASRLPAATLPLSTLVQSPLPTPLQSTHAHLSHSRPPITPAVPTHANLVFPNSFPCNICEKKSCGRRADNSAPARDQEVTTATRLRRRPYTNFELSTLNRFLHALSPIEVHSGCRRERTPDSLHTLK
jgi:hypothetical protein